MLTWLQMRLTKDPSDGRYVYKEPDKLPEGGLSRPLFKKRKRPLIPLVVFLLTLVAAVVILFSFFDGGGLRQSIDLLFSKYH